MACYGAHIAAANPVYEAPTLRILAHMAEDEKRHIERGSVLLEDLLTSAETHRRAAAWQAHLGELLANAGGVTGFPDHDEEPNKLGRS